MKSLKHRRYSLVQTPDKLLSDAEHKARVSTVQTDRLALWVKSWLSLFTQEEKWSQQSITPTEQTYWLTPDTHFSCTMKTHMHILNLFLNIVFEGKKAAFLILLTQLQHFVKNIWTEPLSDPFVSGTGLIRCPDNAHVCGVCVCVLHLWPQKWSTAATCQLLLTSCPFTCLSHVHAPTQQADRWIHADAQYQTQTYTQSHTEPQHRQRNASGYTRWRWGAKADGANKLLIHRSSEQTENTLWLHEHNFQTWPKKKRRENSVTWGRKTRQRCLPLQCRTWENAQVSSPPFGNNRRPFEMMFHSED